MFALSVPCLMTGALYRHRIGNSTRSLTPVGTFDVFVRKNFNLLTPIHAILASTTGGFNKVLIGTKCRLYLPDLIMTLTLIDLIMQFNVHLNYYYVFKCPCRHVNTVYKHPIDPFCLARITNKHNIPRHASENLA